MFTNKCGTPPCNSIGVTNRQICPAAMLLTLPERGERPSISAARTPTVPTMMASVQTIGIGGNPPTTSFDRLPRSVRRRPWSPLRRRRTRRAPLPSSPPPPARAPPRARIAARARRAPTSTPSSAAVVERRPKTTTTPHRYPSSSSSKPPTVAVASPKPTRAERTRARHRPRSSPLLRVLDVDRRRVRTRADRRHSSTP